jgi:hypothetical protein
MKQSQVPETDPEFMQVGTFLQQVQRQLHFEKTKRAQQTQQQPQPNQPTEHENQPPQLNSASLSNHSKPTAPSEVTPLSTTTGTPVQPAQQADQNNMDKDLDPPNVEDASMISNITVTPQEVSAFRAKLPPPQQTATDEQLRVYLLQQKVTVRRNQMNQQTQQQVHYDEVWQNPLGQNTQQLQNWERASEPENNSLKPSVTYGQMGSEENVQSSLQGHRRKVSRSPEPSYNQQPGQQLVSQEPRHELQDYQIPLMLLEQQNKKRLLMARQAQDEPVTSTENQPALDLKPTPPTYVNHALQDYQMQQLILEQQNKKRLLMARQEQDELITITENQPALDPKPTPPTDINHGLQDYNEYWDNLTRNDKTWDSQMWQQPLYGQGPDLFSGNNLSDF